MKDLFDFIHAALPWIAIGLLLAVFFARHAGKKKKEDKGDDYGTEGMCLGMCMGSALGASGVVDIGLGMSLGMLIGLVIGTFVKKEEDNDKSTKNRQAMLSIFDFFGWLSFGLVLRGNLLLD